MSCTPVKRGWCNALGRRFIRWCLVGSIRNLPQLGRLQSHQGIGCSRGCCGVVVPAVAGLEMRQLVEEGAEVAHVSRLCSDHHLFQPLRL